MFSENIKASLSALLQFNADRSHHSGNPSRRTQRRRLSSENVKLSHQITTLWEWGGLTIEREYFN